MHFVHRMQAHLGWNWGHPFVYYKSIVETSGSVGRFRRPRSSLLCSLSLVDPNSWVCRFVGHFPDTVPLFFFTLQLDSILESWICSPSMQLSMLCISIWVIRTDYYDQSATHSSSGSRLYQRHVPRVPLSIQTDDSALKVHGMILASSQCNWWYVLGRLTCTNCSVKEI